MRDRLPTPSRCSTSRRASGGPRAGRTTTSPSSASGWTDGPIKSVVIHAVYLINCASKDREIRSKSIASLVHALRMGDAIGADGVVLHPGSTVGEPHGGGDRAGRRGARARRWRSRTRARCCWRTPPAPATRSAALRGARRAGRAGRRRQARRASAWTPATCWPPATTCAPPTSWPRCMDECDRDRGPDRLRCLHVNDSKMPLGSNRDRHAPLGDRRARRPRLRRVPVRAALRGPAGALRGPGRRGQGVAPRTSSAMRELRRNGLRARKRRG